MGGPKAPPPVSATDYFKHWSLCGLYLTIIKYVSVVAGNIHLTCRHRWNRLFTSVSLRDVELRALWFYRGHENTGTNKLADFDYFLHVQRFATSECRARCNNADSGFCCCVCQPSWRGHQQKYNVRRYVIIIQLFRCNNCITLLTK